jgi:hypothetical protein
MAATPQVFVMDVIEQWACLNCGAQVREKPGVAQRGTYYHVVTGRAPCRVKPDGTTDFDGTHAYPDFHGEWDNAGPVTSHA